MATPVIMPRLGQSVEDCILAEWKVAPGAVVEEGTVLAVIETDKASFDLESTAAGTVLELFWEEGDAVPVLANVVAVGETESFPISVIVRMLFTMPKINSAFWDNVECSETKKDG